MSLLQRARELFGGLRAGAPGREPPADPASRREGVAAVLTTAGAEDALDRQTLTPAEVYRTGPGGRLEGALGETESPFLVVLDRAGAPPNLLEQVRAFFLQNPRVGLIASGDYSLFSAEPVFQLAARREALQQLGGWNEDSPRRLLQLGWMVEDAALFEDRAPAIPARTARLFPKLIREPATLFLRLSGQHWAWPLHTNFLEEQTYPHESLHLYVLDTSQDPEFSRNVRTWLANCNYARATHLTVELPAIQSSSRSAGKGTGEGRHRAAKVYNIMARACRTDLALFLSEGVIPPRDAYVRLLRHFDTGVCSVSALVRIPTGRPRSGAPLVWDWNEGGTYEFMESGTGVAAVGGNGFGCAVLRGDYFRESVFGGGPPLDGFDLNFYRQAVFVEKRRALVDWDCACRYHSSATDWV